MTGAARPESQPRGWARGPSLFVGAVLVATGTGKILDIPGFVDVVAGYQLLPDAGNRIVAYALPFLEFATGLGLWFRLRPWAAAVSAVGIHAMLVSVVIATLLRGIPVANCGCFGVFLARPLGFQTLVEDLVMLALSVAALVFAPRAPAA